MLGQDMQQRKMGKDWILSHVLLALGTKSKQEVWQDGDGTCAWSRIAGAVDSKRFATCAAGTTSSRDARLGAEPCIPLQNVAWYIPLGPGVTMT
jgi:hypothetical protein